MANIPVQLNTNVDASGDLFTQEGIVQGGSETAQQVQNLAQTGLDVFTDFKKKQAAAASKTLLEEFTGYQRKREILAQEDDVLEQEEAARATLDNAMPGSLERDVSTNQLAIIEKTKDKLELDREAVDQGLLSLEDYRRRAESLFYQQVVQTPGLKSEIAAVMSEYLGIDPRGQTAAIEIEKRKAAEQAAANQNAKLKNQMIGDGYWVQGWPDDKNFQVFGQANLDYRHTLKRFEFQQTHLNLIQDMDEEERKREARITLKDMSALQPNALDGMGVYNGVNISELTYPEIRSLTPDQRAAISGHIQGVADNLSAIIARNKAANDQIGDKADGLLQSIEDRKELLLSIVDQTKPQEYLEQQLQRLKTMKDIRIQARANDIQLSDPQAVTLAALADLWGSENLTSRSAIESSTLDALTGTVPNLNNLDADDKTSTLRAYETTVQATGRALDAGFEIDEQQLVGVTKHLQGIVKHSPEELNSNVRQQINRVAANKGLMDRFAASDPQGYQAFFRNLDLHQQQEMNEIRTDLSNRQIATSQFYLEKEGDTWVVTPTTLAIESATKSRAKIGQASRNNTTDAAEKRLRGSVHELNTRRGHIGNMIKARMVGLGISEAEAMRQVATALGMNLRDVKQAAEPQGFAAEAGVE